MGRGLTALVLTLIVIYGAFLRFYHLGSQSVWNDESFSITVAQAIFNNILPEVPSGEIIVRGLLSHALMALSMVFVDDPVLACRIPSAIFGVLMILLVFFFARRVSGSNILGLIAAALIAFLEVEVAWSRQARMYAEFQFFFVLALYLFYLYVGDCKRSRLLLAFVATLMAMLCHQLGVSLILIFILCGILSKIKDPALYVPSVLILVGAVMLPALGIIDPIGVTIKFHTYYYLEYLLMAFPAVVVFGAAGAIRFWQLSWRASWRGYAVLLAVAPLCLLGMLTVIDHGAGARYVYCLLPIFIILFVWYVQRLMGWGGQMFKIAVVAIIAATVIIPGDFVIVCREDYYGFDSSIQQPDFEMAYAYLSDHRVEGDVVVDAWPSVGLLYIGDLPEYYIYPLSYPPNDPVKERYTGSPAIGSIADLERVVGNHEFGWVIVDEYGWDRQEAEIVEWIEGNMSLCDCQADGMVIYHWQWLES